MVDADVGRHAQIAQKQCAHIALVVAIPDQRMDQHQLLVHLHRRQAFRKNSRVPWPCKTSSQSGIRRCATSAALQQSVALPLSSARYIMKIESGVPGKVAPPLALLGGDRWNAVNRKLIPKTRSSSAWSRSCRSGI